MDKKDKAYIVYKTTLNALKTLAENTQQYGRIEVFKIDVDTSDMTEEQKEKQGQDRWYKEQHEELRYSEDKMYKLVEHVMYDKLLNGCKKNLEEETYKDIMRSEIRVVARVGQSTNGRYDVFSEQETEWDPRDKYEYSEDLDEFGKELKKVRRRNSFSMVEGDEVRLEKYSIGIYQYQFDDIDKDIKKLIKKFVRNNLTYCIKKNEIIVPDEYLNKGKEGIEEWRKIKSSSNKNNSMEKRMLKEVFADKKRRVNSYMEQIISKIGNTKGDWSIPSLTVEGKWNATKIRKLVTKVAETKDRQKFIDTPDEEIVKKFKEYWMEALMEVYNEIDKMEIIKYDK